MGQRVHGQASLRQDGTTERQSIHETRSRGRFTAHLGCQFQSERPRIHLSDPLIANVAWPAFRMKKCEAQHVPHTLASKYYGMAVSAVAFAVPSFATSRFRSRLPIL